jgi:hypothetical protein
MRQGDAGKLLSLNTMTRPLTSFEGGGKNSSPQSMEVIETMEETFRERMCDDLDFKGAFRSSREGLTSLMVLKNKGRFPVGVAKKLRRTVGKIGSVLQVSRWIRHGKPEQDPRLYDPCFFCSVH